VVEYSYKLTDFPNDVMDSNKFAAEMRNSNITASMLYMKTRGQDITIFFDTDLSGAEQTTLDGLIAAHLGIPYNYISTASIEDVEESSTTGIVYQPKITLTLNDIEGGTFLILWSASVRCEGSQNDIKIRVQHNDTEILSELTWNPASAGYGPVSGFIERTLDAGDHHFDFDFATSQNNKAAYIRKARLIIMRN